MKKTSTFHNKLFNSSFFIVTTAVLFMFCHNADSKKPAVSTPSAEKSTSLEKTDTSTVKTASRKLVVYYFHGNFRCHSCTMIENLTKQAVNSGFAEQIKSGRVELKIVNVEEPENEHFTKEYKLYTKSVILSDVKNGNEVSWKNLEQVWTKLNDEDKFMEYIKSEVQTLL